MTKQIKLFAPSQEGNPLRDRVERDLIQIWDAINADDELRGNLKTWTLEKLKKHITWQDRTACSWFMPRTNQVCLSYNSFLAGYDKFPEYRSFAKRPDIGSVKFVAPSHQCDHQFLSLLVAHEVSHLIQHRFTRDTSYRNGETYRKHFRSVPKPHGATFKNVYSYIRSSVINPRKEVSQLVAA